MLKFLLALAAPIGKLLMMFLEGWEKRRQTKIQLEIDRQKNAELALRKAAIAALDAAERRDNAEETMRDTMEYDKRQLDALGDKTKP